MRGTQEREGTNVHIPDIGEAAVWQLGFHGNCR